MRNNIIILFTGNSPSNFSRIGPRQAGDLLLQISGDECRGLAPDDAAALLRGTENTKVGIVAERPASGGAGGEKLDLIVTRRKFKVEGVIPREATVNGRKIGVRVLRCMFSAVAIRCGFRFKQEHNFYALSVNADL